MRIAKLKITNFRSFGPETQEIILDQKLSCFIGLNSAGKSAAMAALQKLFGTRSERLIFKEDFHVPKDAAMDDLSERSLRIESEISFDSEEEAIPSLFKNMTINDAGGNVFMRVRLDAKWSPSASSLEGEIDVGQYVVTVGDGQPETPKNVKYFPKEMYGLFQVVYVPALRKTADQLKYASGSILHRLLKTVQFPEDFKKDYEEAADIINEMFKGLASLKNIHSALQDFWAMFHKDSRYKDVLLAVAAGELEQVFRNMEVSFGPAISEHRKFGVDDLGDGYRSLFYLALVCTVLEIEDGLTDENEIEGNTRPLLTFLAVEEPENHIAPQLLGRVIKILLKVSDKKNTQVFITSHTPSIVKRVDPKSITHFRITDEATTQVNAIKLPKKRDVAFKYIKEAVQNYPEIYFAKLVVIGEGDSEDVVFNHLMRELDVDFDDNMVSFAPLGGRFVSHIWRLLETLHIPYITLLDLDTERFGGGWGRIKYVLQELQATGIDRNKLLKTEKGVLSEEDFKKMHKWDNAHSKALQSWIKFLRDYSVYFSAPLDLDFLFLEAFENDYTNEKSYPKGGGPEIPDRDLEEDEYEAYLVGAVQATLKSPKAEGKTYTQEQRELMIWYKYHFLGRGKPVTHMQVLPEIDRDTLLNQLPEVIGDMFKNIKAKLNTSDEED